MRIISGKYGRRRFSVPGGIVARPTTDMARENLFNILRGITDIEGATTLDLFAGTGAITFEMLSRGAAHATAAQQPFVGCVDNGIGIGLHHAAAAHSDSCHIAHFPFF